MMQTNYYLADVQVKGRYPAFLEHYFARRQFNLDITLEDRDVLWLVRLITLVFRIMHLMLLKLLMMNQLIS